MASNPNRFIFTFSFIVNLLFQALLPTSYAHALSDPSGEVDLPSLEAFAEQVSDGQGDELRGVYVPGILAASIVQQPAGKNDFVSPWQNTVTQFGLASRVGSTGLLAHNDLAGETFIFLEKGQKIHLIAGGGEISTFIVSEILQYQALESNSVTSTFVDLETHTLISSSDLFIRIYSRPGQLIFQTCIQAGNDPSWGRLFVIAEPVTQ